MFPGAPVEEWEWKEVHRQWNNREKAGIVIFLNFRSYCYSGQEPEEEKNTQNLRNLKVLFQVSHRESTIFAIF